MAEEELKAMEKSFKAKRLPVEKQPEKTFVNVAQQPKILGIKEYMGWIVASVLGGVLIGTFFIGWLL
jgi:hypothetical protein